MSDPADYLLSTLPGLPDHLANPLFAILGLVELMRVSPSSEGGLGVVAAGRIAADHGGSLERDGRDGVALTLRLPLWVAS